MCPLDVFGLSTNGCPHPFVPHVFEDLFFFIILGYYICAHVDIMK